MHSQKSLYQQRLNEYKQKQKAIEERSKLLKKKKTTNPYSFFFFVIYIKENQLNHNLSQLMIQKEDVHSYNNYLYQSRYKHENLLIIRLTFI